MRITSNGFTPAPKGKGPDTGDIIAGLKPGLVIQPWTGEA